MSPGSSTESYPAFARIGLRENPEKPPPGNLSRPGIEPGPPGFSARRADRYSTGVDSNVNILYLSQLPLYKERTQLSELVAEIPQCSNSSRSAIHDLVKKSGLQYPFLNKNRVQQRYVLTEDKLNEVGGPEDGKIEVVEFKDKFEKELGSQDTEAVPLESLHHYGQELAVEDAREAILHQNDELNLKQEDLVPKFMFQDRSKRKNLIIEVSPQARKIILAKKLKIGWHLCGGDDYIKEPYTINNKVAGIPKTYRTYSNGSERKRAAIIANNKEMDVILINQLSDEDCVVVEIRSQQDKIYAASVYCDITKDIGIDIRKIENIINHAQGDTLRTGGVGKKKAVATTTISHSKNKYQERLLLRRD
ncbi:hypothetical protein ANN_26740 [Periplaneta americana]|uniref:Uncharacterized protein n=1 Tax=Periplaneta americana TaxID=6978 RepID=A0ABQ8RYW2_PERAM|nr:hypothetical protein ANN_26740 [Periplaneta americana]